MNQEERNLHLDVAIGALKSEITRSTVERDKKDLPEFYKRIWAESIKISTASIEFLEGLKA